MKLLSFDIESNGLHGEAFAVGAVLMREDGSVEDEFSARCPVVGVLDDWVREFVLPPLASLPEEYPDGRAMREAFWAWYLRTKPLADHVVVNNGYPVEARFLIACQEDNLVERYWDHPFPMLELGSLLVQIGVKTGPERDEFGRSATGTGEMLAHNPRWDAWAAAITALKAMAVAKQAAAKP